MPSFPHTISQQYVICYRRDHRSDRAQGKSACLTPVSILTSHSKMRKPPRVSSRFLGTALRAVIESYLGREKDIEGSDMRLLSPKARPAIARFS